MSQYREAVERELAKLGSRVRKVRDGLDGRNNSSPHRYLIQ